MPRRPAPRRLARRSAVVARQPFRPYRVLVGIAGVLAVVMTVWWLIPPGAETLRARAESAELAKDWPSALRNWRALNRSKAARGRTWLAEARAAMALDLAAQAETALIHASEADPADPEPWRLRLDILRTEGRTTEAHRVGWAAYGAVATGSRRAILRELMLALLLDDDALDSLPDDRLRARLDRWVAADPEDVEARVAQHRRIAAGPRPGDPDLAAWAESLTAILDRDPHRASAREALVIALDELGESERARIVLDAWPEADRDARFDRLLGRYALDRDSDPGRASTALERALADLPQDWRTRTQLARAYRALDRPSDANREAAAVAAIRERLDPVALVSRLANDLSRPGDPRGPLDLATLCETVGLTRLADAWRREAANASR
jgi:Tetratricopeptide repeat